MNAISVAALLMAVAAVGQAASTPEELMDAVLKDLRDEAASREIDPAPPATFAVKVWDTDRDVEAKFTNGSITGFGNLTRSGNCRRSSFGPVMKITCLLAPGDVQIQMNAEVQERGPTGASNNRLIGIYAKDSNEYQVEIEMHGLPGRRARLGGVSAPRPHFKAEVVRGSVRLSRSYATFIWELTRQLANQGRHMQEKLKLALETIVARHFMPS